LTEPHICYAAILQRLNVNGLKNKKTPVFKGVFLSPHQTHRMQAGHATTRMIVDHYYRHTPAPSDGSQLEKA
jgi:hypothetical protein